MRSTKSTAVEVRYVGTLGVNQWSELNYNERNVVENGFLDEFKLAMANLQANNAAGGARLGSFAYFGRGHRHQSAADLSRVSERIARRRQSGRVYRRRPIPGPIRRSPAAWCGPIPHPNHVMSHDRVFNRHGVTRRPISMATCRGGKTRWPPGLPANFFVVNPHANQVNITDSGAFSTYHAHAVRVAAAAVARAAGECELSVRAGGGLVLPRVPLRPRQHPARNGSVRHAIKTQWDWALPFGRGERFGGNVDRVRQRHHRRLAVQRRRPHPGADLELRQRATRRHDQEGRAEDVQVGRARRSGDRPAHRLHDARRRDPEHAACVQRQLDLADRLQRSRRAGRALLRAAQQRRLHSGQGGRLRAAIAGAAWRRSSRASISA